jgi:hypothetical protein
MTLNIFIDEIRNLLPLDYTTIDQRLIAQTIDEYRAVTLKNEFNQNRSIDDIVTQIIYVDLEQIDELEYPFKTSTHRILRSKTKIPKTINRHYDDSIMIVRNGYTLGERYNYICKEKAVYAGNKFTNKKSIFTFLHNDYMYVKLQKDNPRIALLKNLAIEGVFESPREAYLVNNPNADAYLMDYPLPQALWAYMKEGILNTLTAGIQSHLTERETDE